jgi:hypothetical protein
MLAIECVRASGIAAWRVRMAKSRIMPARLKMRRTTA